MTTPALEKRIYCVVANTVQTPLSELVVDRPSTKTKHTKLQYTDETRTVVQPAGRLIAQAAHVVSKMRMAVLADTLYKTAKAGKKNPLTWEETTAFTPITTIVLAARDSFELNHVLDLLTHANVSVHTFHDFNQPDYGDVTREVMTAIATEPVEPGQVVGILDYLPLWSPSNQ